MEMNHVFGMWQPVMKKGTITTIYFSCGRGLTTRYWNVLGDKDKLIGKWSCVHAYVCACEWRCACDIHKIRKLCRIQQEIQVYIILW